MNITKKTLLISGIAMSISGLVIQLHYHLLKNLNDSTVLALNRAEWKYIHIFTAIVFLLAVIYHVRKHIKWYKNVLRRRKIPTMILTILMIVVTISGIIPLLGGSDSIIEIHDKAAIIFLIVTFGHSAKRVK